MKPIALVITAAILLAYLFFSLPQISVLLIILALVTAVLSFLNMLAGEKPFWAPAEIASCTATPLAIAIGLGIRIGAPFEWVDLAYPVGYFAFGAAAFALLRSAVRALVRD